MAERGLNTNDGDNLPHGQYLHLHVSHNIVPKCQKLRVKMSWQSKLSCYLAHPCRGAGPVHLIVSCFPELVEAYGSAHGSFLHAYMDEVPGHGHDLVA